MEPFSVHNNHKQSELKFLPKSLKCAEAEVRLSLSVCVHSAILPIDHLDDLCKHTFKDSESGSSVQLHRTKCTGIIKYVMSPHFQKELLKSVGGSKYSLLLDESTDISVIKLLGYAIICYDSKLGTITNTFLALEELETCDAASIAQNIKNTLNNFKSQIQNLVGIGTDNASTMVGINNGVYEKLKQEIPDLLLIRCDCHSLQLCVSQAATETFPRHLEFVISETYKWFSKSSSIYKTINDGADPKKIVRCCQTRWLSIEMAISRILHQYLELKTHFDIARHSEKCYTAELLYNMYKDEKNVVCFLFLQPILVELQEVNKLFQSNSAGPTKLLKDLTLLVNSIAKKLHLPTCKLDLLLDNLTDYYDPKPYLAYCFEKKVTELKERGAINMEEDSVIADRERGQGQGRGRLRR